MTSHTAPIASKPVSKRTAQFGLAAAVLLFVACLAVLILGARNASAADGFSAPILPTAVDGHAVQPSVLPAVR